MKTYKEWMKSDKRFDEYIQPGDEVDEAIVDYFMNVLPPRSMSYGYLQAGEPIAHIRDENGRCRVIYTTFAKEAGKWYYKGCCFAGEVEDRRRKREEG